MEKDLKNKTVPELEQIVLAFEQRKFLAKNIFSFVHKHNVSDIRQMSTLSKQFRRQLLDQEYFISEIKTIERFLDPDGTAKYLFELQDGTRIETVELFDNGRKTLCISSQIGCRMNCRFCATARLHLTRNLTAAEIVDQVIQIEKATSRRANNIVYMGMGEPLDNYDEVIKSVRILNNPNGKNVGARHITISTSGIIPGIERFAEEGLQVRLAVSLNAARDAVRQQLMRINIKYPLSKLIAALREYQIKTKRRISFEYVLLKDINDSATDARSLLKLIAGIKANINLIEFNPHPGCDFAPSDRKTMKEFQNILHHAGYEVAIRFKYGQSINAACGQLGADLLRRRQ